MPAAAGISDRVAVRALLVAAATAGHPLSYSELLAQLGHGFSRPKMRALCKTLSAIDAQAAAHGEPELAVLVVRQADGLPGQGWWVGGGPVEHGYCGPWEGVAAAQFVVKLQTKAFDFWLKATDVH